ncbi:hypothetical protein CC78DRAFT_587701 [Lojkania enalia]|uniref:Uncharacterized protein n=1 Tax=Lojkania enalia TaxID=147567 RepID=A0A9P4JWT4_9PLEO|nr:hypothetical protein CC78DRAFT_587701 [Didymosphaeria enalia]
MAADWRFEHPLMSKLADLEATRVRNYELERSRAKKRAAFVRFADIRTAEIVNRSREKRRSQRQRMSDIVANSQSRVEGLREDNDFLGDAIANLNHQKLISASPIRAVIRPCGQQPSRKYLVVASSQVYNVFDDVYSLFIDMSLQAKEIFLKGVTHQLRTPIHGELGSVNLLTEELKAHNLLNAASMENAPGNPSPFNPLSFLNIIKAAGLELMSTVNNMLKLNRWTEIGEL